jgi:hypothetical protein
MSLKTEQYIAVYLLGGPGSGKDAILHNTVLNKKPIVEISLDKLHKAILETKNVAEINDGETLVVNGNADDADKVLLTKKVLESVGYETIAVYVYTTNEVSRARNEQRIKLGNKTFSEEARAKKYANASKNIAIFKETFGDYLFLFNNSNNLMNEETQGWLIELNAELNGLLVKTEVDVEVETFLEGYEDYNAHQKLVKTAKQKTKPGGNDYFSHNEIQNRPKTNKSQDKIPVPPRPSNVGPSHKFTEEKTGFKNFKSKKALPPTATGHADGSNGMIQTEQNKKAPAKALKPPVTQGQIRPLTADGGASNPLAAEEKGVKKSTKTPPESTDARQGDDMDGVSTIGETSTPASREIKRKAQITARERYSKKQFINKYKPLKTSSVADTNNQGQELSTVGALSVESRTLSLIKQNMINRSPAETTNQPEIYEDWGIEGEEVLFEGCRVRTNKPFKRDKKYAVYVKDGTDIKLMMFDRKGSITLQENIKPTDVRFWETRK